MRCPLCGGDFPKLTGHVHDPEGMAWWDRQTDAEAAGARRKQYQPPKEPDATP